MERHKEPSDTDTTPAHPPIDAELQETVWPTVVEYGVGFNLTLDGIPAFRATIPSPSLEMLRHGGKIDVEERSIPGPEGTPDMPVLILRPAGRTGPLPCLYHTANGGKILQAARGATEVELAYVVDFGLVLVAISPPVGPEHPHPALIEGGLRRTRLDRRPR